MAFTLPNSPLSRRPRQRAIGLYDPEQQYRLGPVGSGQLIPTFRPPSSNSLDTPHFGQSPGLGLDRTTTSHLAGINPNQGPSPFSSLGGTLLLAPTAVKGLSSAGRYIGEKTGLIDTNSQAINKLGLVTDPHYSTPESFTKVGGPYLQGTDLQGTGTDLTTLTAPSRLNLGEANLTNIQQGFDISTPGLGLGTPAFDKSANLIEGGDAAVEGAKSLDVAGNADLSGIGTSLAGAANVGSALASGDYGTAAIEGTKTASKLALLSNPTTAPLAVLWSLAEMFS